MHPIRNPRLPMQSRERCRNTNSRKLRVLVRTNDISAYERRSGQLLPSCGFRAESPAHRCRALGLPTLAIIDLQCCSARSDVGDQERSRSFGPTSETPPDCIPRLNEWKDENEKNSDRNRTITLRSDGGSSSSRRRAILLIGCRRTSCPRPFRRGNRPARGHDDHNKQNVDQEPYPKNKQDSTHDKRPWFVLKSAELTYGLVSRMQPGHHTASQKGAAVAQPR